MASIEEPEIAAFGAAVLAAHATAGPAAAPLVAGRSAWHDEPDPLSGPTRR